MSRVRPSAQRRWLAWRSRSSPRPERPGVRRLARPAERKGGHDARSEAAGRATLSLGPALAGGAMTSRPSLRDPAVGQRPSPRPLVAGALALAVGMGIGRFAFTPILPAMRDAFALTPAALALLAAANYLGYLVGAVAATAPVPPPAQRPLVRASLLAVVGTTGLMATTTQPVLWALLRFLAGLASAAILVFGSALVLGWLGQSGRLDRSGWFFSGVGLGIASSGLVLLGLPRVGDATAQWRPEWVAVALLAGT